MREDRSILRRGAPALFLLSALLLPILPLPAAAADATPPDWVIGTAVTLDRTVKDLKANLVIESGGELRITNATLVMNCSKDGEFQLLVKAGGRLVAENANITSGPSRSTYWFQVNGSMELRDSELSGTRGMFDLGGIFITSSQVTISGCHLFGHQWYALRINGSAPTVSGCRIDGNKGGIRIENGANPTISGNTIRDNERDGITVLDSAPVLRDNKISGNWRGIGLFQSKAEVSNNDITGSGLVGIDCSENSDAAVTGNTITGSGTSGISVIWSAPRIRSNTITSCGVGINTTGSAAVIEKNTIGANREWGVFAKSGTPTLDGNKYTDGTGKANGLGAVATVWTLLVTVVDSDKKPVPDATVTIKDRSGKLVYTGQTGNDGTVPVLELFQSRSGDGASSQSTTPHTVKVKWQDLSSSTTVTMDRDRSITAQLTKPAPKGFLPGAGIGLVAAAVLLAIVLSRGRKDRAGLKGPRSQL
jgi:parallel beta-helix repeat protein